MTTLDDQVARLRKFNDSVATADSALHEEGRAAAPPRGRYGRESFPAPQDAFDRESIAMRRNRPVLAIKKGKAVLVFEDKEDSKVWKDRLKKASPLLTPAIKAVGRVEVVGHALDWVGTGWLVKEGIIVTNRHVASEFARRRGDAFTFKQSAATNGSMSASVDFLRELGRDDELAFKVTRVLHIEPDNGPDIAFLAVEPVSGSTRLASHIVLSSRKAGAVKEVAAIGYPARDSRVPDFALMTSIFGDVYDKKRLAPGDVTGVDGWRMMHNCSTLGGSSGSVVVDLADGKALGLHFGGRFLVTNYAVRADVVSEALAALRGKPRSNGMSSPRSEGTVSSGSAASTLIASADVGGASVSIPLQITVSLAGSAGAAGSAEVAQLAIPDFGEESPDLVEDAFAEGKAPDLSKRKGYVADFLGAGKLSIALPKVTGTPEDILELDGGGKVLHYEHFSVQMSSSRRMCLFSAVNINGKQSGRTGRGKWKTDPRIPVEQQIIKECYGNPPKFSRGHMTRREDPAWGSTEAASQRGSDDSMFVTNATPQMQAFNSPIWLALEDYALQHARKDGMKVSVFTGPYLYSNDPIIFGVKVPVSFWKVIAFIHDDTGKLCATGYEMSQRKSLPKVRKDTDEEFVYGQFVSPHTNIAAQVSIASIEGKCGISFGKLAKADPFGTDEESVGDVAPPPLLTLEQIRFA